MNEQYGDGTVINLLIFVADSLRYDYTPQSIVKSGTLIRTLAASLHTPTSFVSLVSAESPENHNVRSFFHSLDKRKKTVFDVFKDGSYFDHPESAMSKIVLKYCPKPRELTELEEPFVWVERALDSHMPYGKIKHGNSLKDLKNERLIGMNYIKALKGRKIDAVKEYIKGIKSVEQHFWTHVDELKNIGVHKRTLIIFTSDHGELLGEYGKYTHGYPPCRELVEVPTVFLNTRLNIGFMRTIDIVPTALGILKVKLSLNGCSGVDVRKEKPKKGINSTGGVLTIWKYDNRKIRLEKYFSKKRNKWIPIPKFFAITNRTLFNILPKGERLNLLRDKLLF